MSNERWRVWDHSKSYGDLLYQRATGESEEMESSKALAKVVSRLYQPGMTLVDVGCGAGHYLRSLRSRVDENISYTGVDATAYYIELARKAFPDAEFKVGDIFNLPLEDNSYDIVINNNVIHHLPPPPTKAFSELIRVARKYVVVRAVFGDRNYIIKEIRTKDDWIDNIEASELDLVTAEDELKLFNYFNLYTETYFREMVSHINPEIGIEIIRDEEWTDFDNRDSTIKTGTRVISGNQVSGNLLLDWRFIILTKPTT